MEGSDLAPQPRFQIPQQRAAMRPTSPEDGSRSNGSSRPDVGMAARGIDPSMVACGNCSLANPRQRKFCSHCGKPLWRDCEECGETNAICENFCGGCGADLKSAVNERIQQFEQALAEAKRCGNQRDFPKALALLKLAVKEHQGHLDGHVDRARRLIEGLCRAARRRGGGSRNAIPTSARVGQVACLRTGAVHAGRDSRGAAQ